MISSRRDRTPAGASNAAGRSLDSGRSLNSGRLEPGRSTARDPPPRRLPQADSSLLSPKGKQTIESSRNSARGGINTLLNTDRSDISANSILRSLKTRADEEKLGKELADINSLKGKFNAFSRPVGSMQMPLRSIFLDPEINNFPPSKTQTELFKRIRASGQPHPSYDLDQDGYVSQEDYRLAKRFDLDGNGVLDPEERDIGKRVLADEFFKAHANELEKFGPQFASRSHMENVNKLATSHCFERSYEQLKSMERTLTAESSKPILECMQLPSDNPLTKHNFYTDKFDCTAWNDFDAIPRSASQFGLNDHGGSRKRLMFSRSQVAKESAHDRLDFAEKQKPPVNTRRVKLITDISIENS